MSSKATQALNLFSKGKSPVDVAIELDHSACEIEDMLQEFWILNQLNELALVDLEIRSRNNLFRRLFRVMKKNKVINGKNIRTYAVELPSLENKFRSLANIVLDLEIKKQN